MTDRSQRLRRIVDVQRRLHQLAETRVAHLDREKAGLMAGRQRLIEALNRDEALQGLFVEAMARRLSALARQADRVNRERDAAAARMQEAALRLKRAERMNDKAARAEERDAWKRGFDDVVDQIGSRDASLP
ncbi:MAG TPA: hypothetical protein VFB16_06270 [Bauldia sp.]|nr:hypothetical protein [Bauldia sp.]